MEEILQFLENSSIQYLSTIGLDGKPKVRPFQFMFEQDGRLWFCTSNKKEVFRELEKQPFIELCASGKEMSWIRLKGEVVFSKNMKIKERIFKTSPLVKRIYKEPTHPDFEVFYLYKMEAQISGIGEPSRSFRGER